MSEISEGLFEGPDRRQLFYRLFSPDLSKGTLVVLHGHGEHSGRYDKFFSAFKDLNLHVAIFDFRGHGSSQGPEVYIENFEEYLRDVSAFVDFLRGKGAHSGKIFILGHSMGGLVAVHWALQNPEKVRGLILSSPCLGLRISGFLVALNRFLNRWIPHFVYRNPVYSPYLTHDALEVERYKKDPAIKRKISVRLLSEVLSYMARLDAVGEFQCPFPVFVLMAGDERIVDNRKVDLFFEKVKAPLKERKVFGGFYHELFNEVRQQEVFEEVKSFILRMIDRS